MKDFLTEIGKNVKESSEVHNDLNKTRELLQRIISSTPEISVSTSSKVLHEKTRKMAPTIKNRIVPLRYFLCTLIYFYLLLWIFNL